MNSHYQYFFDYKFLKAGLLSRGDDLVLIDITRGRDEFRHTMIKEHALCREDAGPFADVIREMTEYLNGERSYFTTPYSLEGSPFQLKVWKQIACIPHGGVKTYRDIALETGHPKAVRAVGSAVGRNSIPIIIPCHRVIKTGGHVGQFGGGTELKIRLLTHEGINIRNNRIV